MRQHGLAHGVADGEQVCRVAAHPEIDVTRHCQMPDACCSLSMVGLPFVLLLEQAVTMETTTLSSKGQLVIPKAVRDDAQVSAGTLF